MIYTSPHPSVEIPDTNHYDFIFGSITEEELSLPVLTEVSTDETYTYGEMLAMIDSLAGELVDRGIGPGDVVAVQVPNSIHFPVAVYAIAKIGAIHTPIGMLMNQSDVERQIEMSGSKLYIGSTDVESIPQIFLTDLAAIYDKGKTAEVADVPSSAINSIPFSSGTTGLPKGVTLSHHSVNERVRSVAYVLEQNGVSGRVTEMVPLPFSHNYGSMVVFTAFYFRAHVVTMPKFDPALFVKGHAAYGVELTYIAPPMALALAKSDQIDPAHFAASRVMVCGAAPLDAKVAQAVQDRLGTKMIQAYGSTETLPNSIGIAGQSDLGSVGFIVPNVEMRLIDPETGEDVPEGEPGEILTRSTMNMDGYLNNEEANRSIMREDGWMHTGDIGRFESDSLFILDRAKEVIKYKGYQVAPAELEALLVSHAEILDAGVVGVESNGLEIPRAFVVVAPGSSLDERAIMDWVASQVTPYKKVRAVELVAEVPKSPNGKIDRNALRQVPFEDR